MANMAYVWHPTLGTPQPVLSKDVKKWTDGGWLKDKPDGFDDADLLPAEDAYVPPTLAVEDAVEGEVVTATPATAKGKSAK